MLSICIITRDEAENLRECLTRIKPLGYEIIVVDTGSKDDSISVAREYTDSVYEYTWCGDFSKARNYAASKATNEYVLALDTDEFLVSFDKEALERLIKKYPKAVGRLSRNNLFVRDGIGFNSKDMANRLYAKDHFRYVGRVHEQVESIVGGTYDTYEMPACVDHCGYDDTLEKRKQKAERNISLLLAMAEEAEDPYVYYQLGKGYYYNREYDKAAEWFARVTTFDLNPKLEYVIDMITMYGYALVNAGRAQEALALEGVMEEFKTSADFVFMMGYVYMQNSLFTEAVRMFEQATKTKYCRMEGVNSYFAYYNAGVIMECLGDKEKALTYYKKCGSYPLAQEGIQRIRK